MNHETDQKTGNRSQMARLMVAALGIVYGDIGTSPLYAFRECLHGPHAVAPTRENVFGVLSLIFWALVIVVSLKYLMLVMRADNRGEGGILALMAMVRSSPVKRDEVRHLIVALGLFGAALLFGDGMITPAISVLSAVEGLRIATPAFEPYIVPITVIILVGLFAVQRRGTGRVGSVFGPVTLLWFLCIAALGIVALLRRPDVLLAVNPSYALQFFLANKARAFVQLGSVFLVVTGAEALYADMGHFGRRPIRVTWFAVVFPCLLLNYFGQGALLVARPEAADNPFYNLCPRGMLYPMVVLATMAAIIASQAVISGVFSLARQAAQFGYFPRVRVQHTSEVQIGQIYVPSINAALLICTLFLVVTFRSSGRLAAAYGVAVTSTMVITTLLLYLAMRHRWHWHPAAAVITVSLLLIVDGAFLGANMVKLLDGGWLPLAVGAVGYTIMTTWRRGREMLAQRLSAAAVSMDAFSRIIAEVPPQRIPGTAIFLTSQTDKVPHTMTHNLRHNKMMHERVILLTVLTEEIPRVPAADRVQIDWINEGFYRVIARYGFMQSPNLPVMLRQCSQHGLHINVEDSTFFLGRENLFPATRSGMPMWQEKLFAFLSRNSLGATRAFRIPPSRVIELGAQIEL